MSTDVLLPPSPTPLQELFRHSYERPDAVALIADGDVWTYQRLAGEVVRLSNGLRRAGIRPGDRITLVVRPAPVYALFLFAAMMTGSIAVSLKTELTAIELNEFLHRQRPALFIHDADLQDVVARMDPALLERSRRFLSAGDGPDSWRQLLDDMDATEVPLPSDIDSPFLLLATSGTTGTPKLVAYSQRVVAHVTSALNAWQIDTDSCLIGSTAVAHISGSLLLLVTIIKGCKEVMLARFNAETVLDVIEEHRGTAMFVAPFICMPLVEAQQKRPRNISSLRVCGVGGDACRPQVAQAFETTFKLQLGNTYGLTECIGSMVFGSDHASLRAVPGCARLVDGQGAEVVPGTVGELQMRGPNLSLGYWTGPGDIVSHTRDGWFASGDLMQQDSNGDYRYVGRCKDLIISNTLNISPIEVENQLIQHPSVADTAVAGAPDDESGQRVVAIVRLTADADPAGAADEILDWLRTRLASFKLPERIVIATAIPRNALGKIVRSEVVRIAIERYS
ncbi:class I adenylate-forming enzyme family protein [Pseudomonas gingeri]|uniref:class I adenylate-forming enzyme family protein n=1 Tax=Pseudomonas gingeri TaxID=117681 RepID=UPI0015A35BB9|nr:class I adenylate-forming enzyme family protein [Pseudomonas gingeri]NWA01706.1 acyl--CoA ligase [Pseudomonas gingeri]NWA12805.1 acyl--CoA ligase [Pseudomonas gingeri]NWA57547.1 acyl--CoA ligase [Pseudomonas gingeri]NWA93176.1 acyl--CoA ligase [Pseudomonas gingeri]NWB03464.1 acyl--CoA ligase [Pseudomonas gingeri]